MLDCTYLVMHSLEQMLHAYSVLLPSERDSVAIHHLLRWLCKMGDVPGEGDWTSCVLLTLL